MKIGKKLTIQFLTVTILTIVAVGTLFFITAKASLKKEIINKINIVAEEKERMLVTLLETQIANLKYLAQEPEIVKLTANMVNTYGNSSKLDQRNSYLDLKNHLTNFADFYGGEGIKGGTYADIMIADLKGHMWLGTYGPDEGGNEAGRDWFEVGKKNIYLGDVTYNPSMFQTTQIAAAPIIDKEGVTIAVLQLETNVATINRLLASGEEFGQSGKVYIINSDNKKISTLDTANEEGDFLIINSEAVKQVRITGKDSHLKDYTNYMGDKVIGSIHNFGHYKSTVSDEKTISLIQNLGWLIIAEINEKEAFASIETIKRQIIVVSIIIGIIVILLSHLVSRRIYIPIQQLKKAVNATRKGRFSEKISIHTNDEIEDLADSFNEMTHDLQRETVSRDYFDKVFNSILDGIITIGEDGIVKSFNPAATRIFGYSAEEVIGNNVSMLMPEPYHSEHDSYIKNYLRTGERKIIGIGRMTSGRQKSGKLFPIDLAVSEMTLNDNKIFIGIIRDITERVKADETIKESERILKEAQNIAHIGNWELDLVNDKLTWSNEIYEMFEIDHEKFDASYDSFIETVHPEDRGLVDSAYKESLKKRMAYEITHRLLMKDGRIKFVSEKCTTDFDNTGKPLRSMGTVQDITKQKKAEIEIESLAKFPSENPNPVMRISKNGALLYANEASNPLLNKWYSRNGKFTPNVMHLVQETFKTNESIEIEVKQRRKTFSAIFIPIEDEDYIYVYGLDISDRKKMENELNKAKNAADDANLAKSSFLANMSHEIRTPMTSIIGMADLLSESRLDEDQQESVRILKNAGDTLIMLINDILDMSKIEAGKFLLDEKEFDLNDLVLGATEIFSTKAKKKGLNINYIIAPDVPQMLMGDELRIKQILVNLIGNAIKFTNEGEVNLEIVVKKISRLKVELLFSVKDTGIGISKDKIKLIFKDFMQADSSITREFGGTGLGTAISQKLVKTMGGRIWVESELDKGSSFCFTIKLKTASKKPVKEREAITLERKKDIPAGDSRPLNILLVEDSEDIKLLIKLFFKDSPYELEMAKNGEEGLKKFRSGKYDIVLMDIQMPVMDGLTATIKIREWEAEEGKEPTPVIALTAHAMKEDMQKSLDAGFTSHITKPIKKEALLEIIYEHTCS